MYKNNQYSMVNKIYFFFLVKINKIYFVKLLYYLFIYVIIF